MKIPATLLLLGGLFYGTYWYLAIHLPDERRAREDPIYAAAVFDSILPYETVLATRRWRPRGGELLFCSYAVVALPETAPRDPLPTVPPAASELALQFPEWILRYGGDWEATQMPETASADDNLRSVIRECSEHLPELVNDRMLSAITEPGSWIVSEQRGNRATVPIYSAPQRIAARIQIGD